MQIQASWEFGFLHFYFEIFYIISSLSTFVSKVSYSGLKNMMIIIIGPYLQKFGFRVDLLAPRSCVPLKRAIPKRESMSQNSWKYCFHEAYAFGALLWNLRVAMEPGTPLENHREIIGKS